MEGALELPGWVDQVTVIFLTLGFPFALLLAWAQESQSEKASKDDALLSKATPSEQVNVTDRTPSFSIAVLPFDNLSDDTSLNGMAEGIAEDIITELSSYIALRVTARNSSSQFKGQAIDLRDVGERLKVRYILEGSLRQVADTIRITAQLINTDSGDHVWAERFESPLTDLHEEQDGIIDKIFTQVANALVVREITRLKREPMEALTGDEIAAIADDLFSKSSRKHVSEAIELMKAAVEKQPDSAIAHACLAHVTAQLPAFALAEPDESYETALKEASRALQLAPADPYVLASVSNCYAMMNKNEQALKFAEQAVALGPKLMLGYFTRASCYSKIDRLEEALVDLDTALELLREGAQYRWLCIRAKAHILFQLARFEEAAELAQDSLLRQRTNVGYITALASFGHLGEQDEAARLLAQYLKWWPEANLAETMESERSYHTSKDYLESLEAGLKLAGLQ